jgi:hypothetical protein
MKALSFVLILVVAMGFGMMACNDNADPLVAPNDQAVTQGEAISLAKGGPVHSANGTAHVALKFVPGGLIPVPKGWDLIRVLTFNAGEYADGSYKGRVMKSTGTRPR